MEPSTPQRATTTRAAAARGRAGTPTGDHPTSWEGSGRGSRVGCSRGSSRRGRARALRAFRRRCSGTDVCVVYASSIVPRKALRAASACYVCVRVARYPRRRRRRRRRRSGSGSGSLLLKSSPHLNGGLHSSPSPHAPVVIGVIVCASTITAPPRSRRPRRATRTRRSPRESRRRTRRVAPAVPPPSRRRPPTPSPRTPCSRRSGGVERRQVELKGVEVCLD